MCFWRKMFQRDSSSSSSYIIDVDAEAVDDVDDIDHHYENLVFEGGGVKGLSLAAACMELDKCGILDDIYRFAGSSAGAIIAAGLAIGYTPKELVSIMMKTNFANFVDDSAGVIRDIHRLINDYGYAKGTYFKQWVQKLVKKKTGYKSYTFGELYKDTKKELIITGTNLTQQKLVLFSYKTHPDLPIATAVRISMSIPYFSSHCIITVICM